MAETRLSRGLFEDIGAGNTAFRLALGLCPAVGAATNAVNGLALGLAVGAALLVSNIIVSLLRRFIPTGARPPAFLIIICTVGSILQMLMTRLFPDIAAGLGVYLPLLAVNGLIFCQAATFASGCSLGASAANGLGLGLVYALVLTVFGGLRELLGSGSLFAMPILGENFESMGIINGVPGGLVLLGMLLGLFNTVTKRGKNDGEVKG